MTRHNGKRILSALCTLLPCSVFAKSGGVNYSWGADALASMHDYVVTMMLYVQYIIYAHNSPIIGSITKKWGEYEKKINFTLWNLKY